MPNVLVRDLPADVHAELQRRAARAGQSLQQFLIVELTRLSATPTVADLFARVERRRGGRMPLADAAANIEAGRRER
jgi:plasmid stability protein